jgi:hypothetical protein
MKKCSFLFTSQHKKVKESNQLIWYKKSGVYIVNQFNLLGMKVISV